MVSGVFQASPVWSVPQPTECQHWSPQTPDPLHWTVYPLTNKEALGNILANTQSPLFTHPRGASPVWCWASDEQLALCGASCLTPFHSLYLEGGGGAPGPLSIHDHTEWSPPCRSNEERLVLVKDSWASCPLVLHEEGRDALCDLAFHFIQFLLPWVVHFPPPLVGISFSQDQVTWFHWNGVSFPIVMPLLSLCLWYWLHLSLHEGFTQSLT